MACRLAFALAERIVALEFAHVVALEHVAGMHSAQPRALGDGLADQAIEIVALEAEGRAVAPAQAPAVAGGVVGVGLIIGGVDRAGRPVCARKGPEVPSTKSVRDRLNPMRRVEIDRGLPLLRCEYWKMRPSGSSVKVTLR